MKNCAKYEKTYFMPPEECYDWVKDVYKRQAKKESDSVTSQRILLKSFVIDQLGVAESDILEYVDDLSLIHI